MARQRKHEPADALDEIASLGERVAQWVGAHPALVIGIASAILALAAALGGYRAYVGSRSERASAAATALRSDLVVAMGGKPGDTEIAEPANPETARSVRTDFAERYLAFAKDWSGTPTEGLALLEAGQLFDQLGNGDRALEVWTEGVDATPAGSPALGILHARIARQQEQKGDFEAAARAHEAAAAVPGFPLAAAALADAARCWIEAGKDDLARASYQRLKAAYPEHRAPAYVDAALAELEFRSGAPAPAPASASTAPAPPSP